MSSRGLWSPPGEESAFCPPNTHDIQRASSKWWLREWELVPRPHQRGCDGASYRLLCTWPRTSLRPSYTIACWVPVAFWADSSHFIEKKAEGQWGCAAGKFAPCILLGISLAPSSTVSWSSQYTRRMNGVSHLQDWRHCRSLSLAGFLSPTPGLAGTLWLSVSMWLSDCLSCGVWGSCRELGSAVLCSWSTCI